MRSIPAILGFLLLASASSAGADEGDFTLDSTGRPIFAPIVDRDVIDHDVADRLERTRQQYAHDPECQRVLGPLIQYYRTGDSTFDTEFSFANVGYSARRAKKLARTMPPLPTRIEDAPRFQRQMDAYTRWSHRPLRRKVMDAVRSAFRSRH